MGIHNGRKRCGRNRIRNFNAAGAVVKFNGLSVHPGYAYGKMVMPTCWPTEFVQLPANETPATTRDYEVFSI